MSIYTPKQLCATSQLTTSATTYYTVPASTTAIIKQILLSNATSTDASATVHFVPSAGSASTSNKTFAEVVISANTTQVIDLSSVLPTGSTIRLLSGTASAINVHISGVEVE